ncbi:MAG: phosphate ABC transporter permease subunit PstC [Thermoanaerobaculia bacterium]|nr:phosphate ABC transporter permease subunit PstC [Thermoanaerobaculia bacterium]
MARPADRVLSLASRVAAAASAVVVMLIALFVGWEAWPALRDVGSRFVTDSSWHPAAGTEAGTFGLLPMAAATGAAAAGVLVLATPAALLSAIFCRFYAPRPLAMIYRRLVELLAGVPSVVYGFWGLVVLVPLVRRLEPPGASLLTGILVLALMILPTVALTVDAAFGRAAEEHLAGGAALGLSRPTLIFEIVLPASRSGLATGLMLGAGRALGETMAVLMVCGNVVQIPDSLFDPVRTLTANIALEMAYATDHHRAALFVSGLVLLAAVSVLVLAAGRWGGVEPEMAS